MLYSHWRFGDRLSPFSGQFWLDHIVLQDSLTSLLIFQMWSQNANSRTLINVLQRLKGTSRGRGVGSSQLYRPRSSPTGGNRTLCRDQREVRSAHSTRTGSAVSQADRIQDWLNKKSVQGIQVNTTCSYWTSLTVIISYTKIGLTQIFDWTAPVFVKEWTIHCCPG